LHDQARSGPSSSPGIISRSGARPDRRHRRDARSRMAGRADQPAERAAASVNRERSPSYSSTMRSIVGVETPSAASS
jgi:hypothetical protein